MKSHISATIDEELLRRLDAYRLAERRSRSQALELAIERFLEEEAKTARLVVSSGSFAGAFSREDTYARD